MSSVSTTQAPVFQSLETKSQQLQAPSGAGLPLIWGGQTIKWAWLQAVNTPVRSAMDNFTPISRQPSAQPTTQWPAQSSAQPTTQATTNSRVRERLSKMWWDIVLRWKGLADIRATYPEFAHIDDDTFKKIGWDIALRGKWIDDILQAYPELLAWGQIQWWAKWQIAPEWIPQIKPIFQTTPWAYNPLKTVANLPWSLANVWINIANMSLSPVQTVKAIVKTAVWWAWLLGEEIGKKLFWKENYKQAEEQILQQPWAIGDLYRFIKGWKDQARLVTDYFKWYGDKEELQRRLEEDPAWVASDVLSILWIGWTAIAKAWQVTKLWKVAQIWQKIAQVEKYDPYNFIPRGAKAMAEQPWVIGTIWEAAVEPLLSPISSYQRQIPKAKEGVKVWANILAKKLLDNKIKITSPNKNLVRKASWVEPSEFILENDLQAWSIDEIIDNTRKFGDEAMGEKLKTFESIKEPQAVWQRERLMANSIVSQAKNDISELYWKPFDDITPDEILPELQEQFNIVKNIEQLGKEATTSAIKLQALQSLYDMYNSHLKYDLSKKRILSSQETIRLWMQKQLEQLWEQAWVDIKSLNKKIAGAKALEKWLIQAWDRMDNNNLFWLSDTQTAILSAALWWTPIDVVLSLAWKWFIENLWVRGKIASSLYTKWLKPNEMTVSTPNNRPTARGNVSAQFGGSDTTMNSSKPNTTVVVPKKNNAPKQKGNGAKPKAGLWKEVLEQNISNVRTKADYPERKNRQKEYSRDEDSPVKFTSWTRPTYKRHIDWYIGSHHEWVRNTGAGFYKIFGWFDNVPKVKLDFSAEKSYYDGINNLLVTKKHSWTEFNAAVQDYLEQKTGISFADYSKLPSAKPAVLSTKEEIFINQLKTAQKYSDQAKSTDYNLWVIKRNIHNIENSNRMWKRAEEELSRRKRELDKIESAYKTKQNQFENAVVNAKKIGVKTIMSLDEQGIPVVYFETPKGQISFHAPNYWYQDFNIYDSVSELAEYLPAKVRSNVDLVDNYKRSWLSDSREVIEKLSPIDFNKISLPLKKK